MARALTVALVCAALFAVGWCSLEGLEPQESGGVVQWLHSLLPTALVGRKPYFCKWHSCPTFNVTDKNLFFETRVYDEVSWVTCPLPYKNLVSLRDWEKEREACFWSLYGYISGNNAASQQIKMTVPVVERFADGAVPFMGFYIPGSDVPAPKNANLTVVTEPQTTYYVRSFSGFGYNRWTHVDNWRIQTEYLTTALKKMGIATGGALTAASYNSPMELFCRHNEVWINAA